jgi:hypothetical protein
MPGGRNMARAPADRLPRAGPRGEPSRILHDRIRERIAETAAPPFRTRDRVILAGILLPLLTAAVAWIGSELVYHHAAFGLVVNAAKSGQRTGMLVLLIAIAIAVTLVAVWRGRRGFGAAAILLAASSALVAPLYGAITMIRPLHLHDASVTDVTISPWGVRCALIAAVTGLGATGVLALTLRRAVPAATKLRGAAIGAAAGAWAGIAVFAFCPSAGSQHLLVGHLLPVVALSLIGALATPRWLRP